MAESRCANCGFEPDAGHDEPQRQPCPQCGSLNRDHSAALSVSVNAEARANASVERGLNELRLAVLGILVTIGLTVGFGVGGPWYIGVAAGLASFAAACALIAWRPSRHYLMEFVHRLTGS